MKRFLKMRPFCVHKGEVQGSSSKGFRYLFSQGFTLIELMVVIAITGILAGIAIPAYISFVEKAKITVAISDIKLLQRDISDWQSDHGALPLTLEEMGKGDMKDPWGNPYQYLNFETIKGKGNGKKRKDHNLVPLNEDFDLYSMGKDGKSQTPLTAKASRDDIIRANNGSYVGAASDY
ncbi:MAG: prepilin-type N-terminal cleavage/methylation domain-containing protein [Desulfatiglans sp.]|nr:prepilin-type N-terminal cleavage/methylation domain-containing protein [Desulfatiglans sp.]